MSGLGRGGARQVAALWAVGILVATAIEARAEPSVSGAHRALPWMVVVAGAVVCALIPHVVRKVTRSARPKWAFWLASALLVVAFLLFLAPLIVAFGGIMATGRTM